MCERRRRKSCVFWLFYFTCPFILALGLPPFFFFSLLFYFFIIFYNLFIFYLTMIRLRNDFRWAFDLNSPNESFPLLKFLPSLLP